MSSLRNYYGLANFEGLKKFVIDMNMGKSDSWNSLIQGEDHDPEKIKKEKSLLYYDAYYFRNFLMIYFTCVIEKTHATEIEKLLKENKKEEALIYLKENAKEISIANIDSDSQSSWDRIPDSSFDPSLGYSTNQ